MYINKALIYGNLTRDPEAKALPNGTAVTSFSVATNRVYKDKNGAKQESTDFHNIVSFGRQAEVVVQYLKKGSGVYVEGRIQTRSWDDKDGTKKYRTEIVADTIQFGPKSGGAAAGGGYSGSSSTAASSPKIPQGQASASGPELDTIEYPEEDINPDDIPF
jgi:single-strand DNA-binding protein